MQRTRTVATYSNLSALVYWALFLSLALIFGIRGTQVARKEVQKVSSSGSPRVVSHREMGELENQVQRLVKRTSGIASYRMKKERF